MIVVCGNLERVGRHEGLAMAVAARAAIAARSAGAGTTVQVIGIVADGPSGDRRLIELAEAGIGHAAVLRGALRDLEPADVDLALRYLLDIRVIIEVAGPASLHATLAAGAAYSSAAFVLIGAPGATEMPVSDLPESAIVLEAPAGDPDGTFAGFVGAFAARVDGGMVPADAWAATVLDLKVDPVTAGPDRRGRASSRSR